MSPPFSLLNKIIEGNIDVIKIVNFLPQKESLTKDTMLIFDMYLHPCTRYSGGKIIGLSDKN